MDNQRLNLALTIKRVFHQIFVLEPLQLLLNVREMPPVWR